MSSRKQRPIPTHIREQVDQIVADFNQQTIKNPECFYAPRYSGHYLYLERYNYGALDPVVRLKYQGNLDNRKTRDLREVVMNLTPAYEKWEAEKIAEGEKRGERRGERRGKKLGEKLGETNRSLQIASRLLEKQMPIAEIAELTELTIEQIQKLQGL
jgi:hypothetical protein